MDGGDALTRVLRDLTDRQALRDLAARYARIPDDRDYDLVDEVFTSDAQVIGPDFHLEGREQIRAGMRSIERYEATQHTMHQQTVELHGDEGEGEVYCVAYHLLEVDGRAHKLDWGIRYRDRYRREPEGWRLARRELQIVWRQQLPLEA
jgi:uncharacterized protein (TIGR02246 family)